MLIIYIRTSGTSLSKHALPLPVLLIFFKFNTDVFGFGILNEVMTFIYIRMSGNSKSIVYPVVYRHPNNTLFILVHIYSRIRHTSKQRLVQDITIYGSDQQGWYGMFVACGIWRLADVSSVSPSSESALMESSSVCSDEGLTLETSAKHHIPRSSDEGLTLETSAKHHIPQATNIPYQPCWSDPYSAYSPTQKNSFFQN